MVNQDKYTNREIAHLLRSIAAAYLIKKENRFKIIAYENSAEVVEKLAREIKDVWKEGKIYSIDGIGQKIGSCLDGYLKTGQSKHFQTILKGIPESVFEMMKIPSVGPMKAYDLAKKLNINNKNTAIKELIKAVKHNKIASLDKFGKKSQTTILDGIKIYKKRRTKTIRTPLPFAYQGAIEIKQYLLKNSYIKKVEILGSLRRMCTTIGDVDIAIEVSDNNKKTVIQYILDYPHKISVDNAGLNKISLIITSGMRVDIRLQKKVTFGTLLQYLTGSKLHNIRLREYAQKKGLSISEYGIKEIKKGKKMVNHVYANEKDLYNFLGLKYIPAEIREGTNEIEVFQKKALQLINLKDIKGDFHIHSNYQIKSSHDYGTASYSQIADYATKLKYDYVGFADHNPRITGHDKDDIIAILKKRKETIKNQMKGKKIKYFIGLEVDILTNGTLAIPQEGFKYLDYVVVGIHSSFSKGVKDMTNRVIKGLNNKKVKVLAHPTGRLIGKREGFELNWNKIFSFCKVRNIAIEINSWPERLDLPDTLVKKAINSGVKLIINTDAHDNSHMDNMFYGVSVARRGWAEKTDIINTYSIKDLEKWIRR
ncbi:MAG: PHP domain-containing protein [bacterium]